MNIICKICFRKQHLYLKLLTLPRQDMRSLYYKYRSFIWIIIFFIAILFILSAIKKKSRRAQNSSGQKDRGLFRFDSNTRQIQVRNLKGELILEGDLGVTIDPSYSAPEESTKDGLHYTWGDHVILSITKEFKNCLLVDWDTISDDAFTPMDCFSLGQSMWFGGGELNIPSWPVSKASVASAPFYPKLYYGSAKKRQHYTSVVEPYWLSSSGVAIYVDNIVPLHVSLNANGDGKLCLKADTKGYPTYPAMHLKYSMCFGSNLKSTHMYMASRFFEKPPEPFSKSLMRHPVCTVKSPSQSDVERFFRGVVIRQFACGHINIGFQHNLAFDEEKFSQPALLIRSIHQKKMKMMATVDSSFGTNSKEYYTSIPNEFKVIDNGNESLDLSKNKVASWFLERVKVFQEKYKIDTLRFCCGQIKFPVDKYGLGKGQNPGFIVQNYARIAAKVGKSADIKVGFKTQALPLVIKIVDRNSEWGREMGLRSIIPMVLSVGISGYLFVTIGPIGGIYYGNSKPEKELYIRWMQLSVFFPVIEFSIYPWDYDAETTQISAEILNIRSMLWDNILTIAKQSVDTGAPVIRPMWWISPNDPKTYNLNSQFMLGDIYLVAPILWSKKSKHDVYLPKGVWREMFGKGLKREIEVGRWITLDINLKMVVYFECLLCKN